MLSIFNNETKKKFRDEVSIEKKLEAYSAVENFPESICIRSKEDSMMNIALKGKNLHAFDKQASLLNPEFLKFLKDYRSIPEEERANRILLFDTETTDKYNAYAVSIAMIVYNISKDSIEDEFYTLINPKDVINQEAIEVHKITPEMVMNEEEFSFYVEKITSLCKNIDFAVGHNVDFDIKVLEREYERLGLVNPLLNVDIFDTMLLSKDIVQAKDIKNKIKNPQLKEAMEWFGIEKPEEAYHNALVDTRACLDVFRAMMSMQEVTDGKKEVFRVITTI